MKQEPDSQKIPNLYFILGGTNEPIVEPITLEATHKFGNISGKIFVMKNGPENEKEILKLQRNNSKAVIVLSAVLSMFHPYSSF
jgi:hypothetical protein